MTNDPSHLFRPDDDSLSGRVTSAAHGSTDPLEMAVVAALEGREFLTAEQRRAKAAKAKTAAEAADARRRADALAAALADTAGTAEVDHAAPGGLADALRAVLGVTTEEPSAASSSVLPLNASGGEFVAHLGITAESD